MYDKEDKDRQKVRVENKTEFVIEVFCKKSV